MGLSWVLALSAQGPGDTDGMAAGLAAVRLDDDARRMEMPDSESGHSFQSTCDVTNCMTLSSSSWSGIGRKSVEMRLA